MSDTLHFIILRAFVGSLAAHIVETLFFRDC